MEQISAYLATLAHSEAAIRCSACSAGCLLRPHLLWPLVVVLLIGLILGFVTGVCCCAGGIGFDSLLGRRWQPPPPPGVVAEARRALYKRA